LVRNSVPSAGARSPSPLITQSKSQNTRMCFGTTGSTAKILPPSKSVLKRSKTMTFGAIRRNVLA
jgi:hypothetical protein